MKKLIVILSALLISSAVYAEEYEEEFTWAKYEMYCYTHGVEPSYEEYVYLVEHPQCLIFENEQE